MPDFPVAESLGCRALKGGALYLVFLLAAAGLLAACVYVVRGSCDFSTTAFRVPETNNIFQKE
jgi:hypothetical protein